MSYFFTIKISVTHLVEQDAGQTGTQLTIETFVIDPPLRFAFYMDPFRSESMARELNIARSTPAINSIQIQNGFEPGVASLQ